MKTKKILIVASNYDNEINNGLKSYAFNQLKDQKWIKTFLIEVPGSFEIPSIIEKYIKIAEKKKKQQFYKIMNEITNG